MSTGRDFALRRQLLRLGVAGSLGVVFPGCGTILYPERRGQPAGALDWKIVALDAVGLLFFFVPGVIAFAVDFNNGTIYLPAEHCPDVARARHERQLVPVTVPAPQLTLAGIEHAVSDRAQRDVQLCAGTYQTKKLDNIGQFWPTREFFASS